MKAFMFYNIMIAICHIFKILEHLFSVCMTAIAFTDASSNSFHRCIKSLAVTVLGFEICVSPIVEAPSSSHFTSALMYNLFFTRCYHLIFKNLSCTRGFIIKANLTLDFF